MAQKSYLHKALLIIMGTVIIVGITIAVLFPPYYNIARLKADTHITDSQLISAFNEDPVKAQGDYIHKVLLLEGRVTRLEDERIIMGTGLRTIRIDIRKRPFRPSPGFEIGQRLVIKGVCFGTDLNEVLMSYGLITSVRN